jgi:hypothetical protein
MTTKLYVFVLALACTVTACGSDSESDPGSAVLGYSYDCYGRTYELPTDATILLHEWFCRAQEPDGALGVIDCWQSAEDRVAIEDPSNPHERLTGCSGSLDLESRSGEVCTVRIDCQE